MHSLTMEPEPVRLIPIRYLLFAIPYSLFPIPYILGDRK